MNPVCTYLLIYFGVFQQVRDGTDDGRGFRCGGRRDARGAHLRGLRDATQRDARRRSGPGRQQISADAATKGGPQVPHERRV